MSFFRYPGGKSKIKNEILPYLKSFRCSQYIEPFFGGGSIGLELLCSRSIKNLWLNDKDIGIACLWDSIINHPKKFKCHVKKFVPSISAFYDIRQQLLEVENMPKVDDYEQRIDLGFKKLAIHQISYSGLGVKSGSPLGGKEQNSKYKINCRWSPDYICKKVDQLHHRFSRREVKFTCLDFEVLIDSADFNSMLYLDPPYYVKGNDLYQYGFSQKDHERLAAALVRCQGKWLLSYDDCEEIRNLYTGRTYMTTRSIGYSIKSVRNRTELLISNHIGDNALPLYLVNYELPRT